MTGLAVLVACTTTALAQPRERLGQRPEFDPRYYQNDDFPEPRESGTKLCSVYAPNAWRDTIAVPATWTWRDCRDYAALVGATNIHLLCIFPQGRPKMSMGGPGEPPDPDCGWARPR